MSKVTTGLIISGIAFCLLGTTEGAPEWMWIPGTCLLMAGIIKAACCNCGSGRDQEARLGVLEAQGQEVAIDIVVATPRTAPNHAVERREALQPERFLQRGVLSQPEINPRLGTHLERACPHEDMLQEEGGPAL